MTTMALPQLHTFFQTFQTDPDGQIFVTGALNVEAHNKVNVEIVPGVDAPVGMTVVCSMGKISGTTLTQQVGFFPLENIPKIHTFEVVGPEFSIVLIGAAPRTDVAIQAWVFVH
jgi:hypothetical protein